MIQLNYSYDALMTLVRLVYPICCGIFCLRLLFSNIYNIYVHPFLYNFIPEISNFKQWQREINKSALEHQEQ